MFQNKMCVFYMDPLIGNIKHVAIDVFPIFDVRGRILDMLRFPHFSV